MLLASWGLIFGIVNKVTHIRKKFTIIEVTMISMPRKKSPANCEPNDPMLAITPATINATYGVWFVG